MLFYQRGAVLLAMASFFVVVLLSMPIWPGSIEQLGTTNGRDEQTGQLALTGGYHKWLPASVPFWKSDYYRCIKTTASNPLLLVP